MKYCLLILVSGLLLLPEHLYSQNNDAPYEWSWKRDGAWLAAGLGGTGLGLALGRSKTDFSEAEVLGLDTENVLAIDRWAAGNFSEKANATSDIPFYGSFAVPFTLLLDGQVNDHAGVLFGLYLESLSTTSALFTITAGLVNRPRPLAYSEEAPLGERQNKNAQRSFYSGHVAAATTALVFAAKVHSDLHPDSRWNTVLWTTALAVPAYVGYLRIKAGKHFLTDVVLGYGLGALSGYLIPELHQRENGNVRISPTAGRTFMGEEYQGMALQIKF